MAYNPNQYSDPFTDHPGHQNNINGHSSSGAPYSDIDATSYYSPSMFTTRTDGDLVLTHQSDHVQRRQSNSDRSTHSKKFSMDRTGNAAGGSAFYDSEPQNLSAGTGGIDSSKLSQLTEEDEDEFSQKYANPSYGAGLDGNMKAKPYDTPDEGLNVSLMKNAAGSERPGFSHLEYAEPTNKDFPKDKGNAFTKFLASGRYPLEQRIEDKKRGIGRQKYPFVVWTLTLIMIGVFIWELVLNAREQGSPISLKPVVNSMLGPSSSALINLGARFPACMKLVESVPPSTNLPCLNDTANPPDQVCTLEEVCGFGGFHGH